MNNVLFSHKTDLWSTPRSLFNELDAIYHFTLDPCATPDNALCDKFFTETDDGLSKDWSHEVVFCNPPYSCVGDWVFKAVNSDCLTVMLLPARTDTKWFHDLIYNKYPIHFIKGRLKFGSSKNSAPFPSMLVLIDNNHEQVTLLK